MSSYISTSKRCNTPDARIDWHAITWDRLANHYGPQRADAIMAGKDPATQADLAAWRSLGQRSAA